MAPSPSTLTRCCINLPRRKPPPLSIVPICLACVTSLLILLYMSFTFENFFHLAKTSSLSSFFHVDPPFVATDFIDHELIFSDQNGPLITPPFSDDNHNSTIITIEDHSIVIDNRQAIPILPELTSSSNGRPSVSKKNKNYEEEIYHDKEIFHENYKEMKRKLKIYIYPHKKSDPFANALLPTYEHYQPSGNYASEASFKDELFKSHFITENPLEADLFYLPFSISNLRHDRRVSVGGLPDFILNYMTNITHKYPFWNRTGGADHFYVACHSIGKHAMEKVDQLKSNAIQVTCSSSYYLSNYFTHKDVSLPQIWPRHDDPQDLASTAKRKKLAFYAGTAIAPLRKTLVERWGNDSAILVHGGRLKTPYNEQLLSSKYCLHVKGFEVNTARIGDALYYGCVPVILADYYDLPFMDILNWKSFAVVITSSDIPNLKKILRSIGSEKYAALQANVLKVRKHFMWNSSPLDYDAFYMVMYELWLRRSSIRVLS